MASRIGEWDGHSVLEVTLASEAGARVALMSYGVAVRDWRVPVPGEAPRPVVLGFEDFAPYPEHSPHFGAVCGRVANRIANARFGLGGEIFALEANWRGHVLHGGERGLSRRVWTLEGADAHSARFSCISQDGEGGFPGTVRFTATYRFEGASLWLDLEGMPDRPTPISLIQHHYFNLGTGADVLDHRVEIGASAYTEPGADLLPTGAVLPVAGTVYDFREGRVLRQEAGDPIAYDVNLILATGRDRNAPAARVTGPDGALEMTLHTDRPGIQLYNGVTTSVSVPGLEGRRYGAFSGLCLEDQLFPGALVHPHFPDIIATPDRPYRHSCAIAIGAAGSLPA